MRPVAGHQPAGPEAVDRDAVRVGVDRGHLVPPPQDSPVPHRVRGQHRLDVVLGPVQHPRVPRPPDAVVERDRQPGEVPARAVGLLVRGIQAAQLQELRGPRLEPDRPRQPWPGPAFEHGHADPGQGEFSGQQQAGRADAGDQDVGHRALLK